MYVARHERKQDSMVDRSALTPESPDQNRTRLRGSRLWLARAAYILLLGAELVLFSLGLAAQYQYSTSGYTGVSISHNLQGESVLTPLPGLAAEEAGIQAGDVLLRVDNRAVAPFTPRAELQRALLGPVGKPVQLDVRRAKGDLHTFAVSRDTRLLAQLGVSPSTYALYSILLDILVFTGFLVPALILFFQKSDDWLAIFLSATLLIVSVGNTGEVVAVALLNPAWWLLIPVQGMLYNILVLMLLFVFPNGSFVPRWTRAALVVGIVWALLKQLPGPYNPLYQPMYVGNLFDLAIFGLGIYAQVYRYRYFSTTVERQQTKWVVFGMAVAFVGLYAYNLPQFLVPALQEPSVATFQFRLVGQAFASLTLLVFAASLLLSIQRYRLYDIDLIINRTLVYVPLTAILAGIFAVSSDLSKRFFLQVLGGETEASGLFATLVIVIAWEPIKDAIQKRVDKLIKRLPNPEKNLDAFIERVQTRVYPAELLPLTRNLLEEAVQGFQAQGGAVFLDGSTTPTHAARGWDGRGVVSIPIGGDEPGAHLGTLVLGARRDGQAYSKRERALLGRAAQVVAQAVAQDREIKQSESLSAQE